jgi:hypothetical protein
VSRSTCLLGLVLCAPALATGAEFRSAWPANVQRPWVGPEFWANRLQDWQIANGRLECLEARLVKPMRAVHLLTRRLGRDPGDFRLRVRAGLIGNANDVPPDAAAGFLIGAGPELDYRAAALVHHSPGPGGGIIAAITVDGRAVFRDMTAKGYPTLAAGESTPASLPAEIDLQLSARPGGGKHTLELEARDAATKAPLSKAVLENVDGQRLVGSVALISHPGSAAMEEGQKPAHQTGARFWFRDWRVSGSKVEAHDDRLCGPILSTQYTLSRSTLKMTAQMMPLGEADTPTARLAVLKDGAWKPVATADVARSGYTATFRVENWDASADTAYRVLYDLKQPDGTTRTCVWSGTVRREPVDQPQLVVAAFTGNHNMRTPGVDRGSFWWTLEGCWFPHDELVRYVAHHDPDLLFFSGDQVYEGASPTRPELKPLDYLYKWYLWCWAFRELAKDRPCVCIPDDHDVYQGNLWGAGGRPARLIEDGGYTRPPEFVKMVERTQTSNLPDPYDRTPVAQGIGVYYCALNYGWLSFAIIEDRKFKSAARDLVPEGQVVNGWFQNPDFDPATQSDVAGATLLGERQLKFLHNWALDWSHGACMKVVLSQTLFSNVATVPKGARNDGVLPGLEILPPGEYPPDHVRAADTDSNGWPQTGRNKALREMRRGFAVHLCGDQHLGSTVQYGIDDFRDAGFALCVPSIANLWPRRWFPSVPGDNRVPGAPKYTGDFRDGFGNPVTVLAVANPARTGLRRSALYDRSPGYGIVRFDRKARTTTIECWPRWQDPSEPAAAQYPGWPVTFHQENNYGRRAAGHLPTIQVSGPVDPVVQIIDESTDEVVYALRIAGSSYRPKVFKRGLYTVKVGEPDSGQMKTLRGIRSGPLDQERTLRVEFPEAADRRMP